MSRRSDAERRFDHAPHHDEHAVRSRRRNHAQGFPQRATLRELDIDAVHRACEPRDVGRDNAALVDHHGQNAPTAHGGKPLEIVGGERLLHELDTELLENGEHVEGALARPPRVRVHPERLVGRVPHRPENRFVAVGPKFDLEDRVGRGFLHLLANLLGRIEADGERGARCAGRVEPP